MSNQRAMQRGFQLGSLILGGVAIALVVGSAQTGCGGSNGTGAAGSSGGSAAGSSGNAGTGGGDAGTSGAAGAGGGAAGMGGSGGGVACLDQRIEVAADITTNTTWPCNTYLLKQKIHIDGGSSIATLTIAPGSTIYGDGNPSNPAALISTRNGRLIANGTPTAPITFTSYAPIGDRAPGDTFAGVVMLGNGVLNSGTCVNGTGTCAAPGYFERVIEGIPATDARGKYGGTDNTWNCGEISYARIQFGGYMLATNIELNGLTLGGCGTQTKVSYVQVHRGLDDGVEVFGGAVNMDHIVVSGVDDDSLDWDFGWSGKVQFLIVHQAYTTGDKGFEADNFVDTENITPRSNPEIWNATMIGQMGNTKVGMHLRRGTWYKLRNFIVYGFGTTTGGGAALDVDANATMAGNDPTADWPTNISIENSVFFGGPVARTEVTTTPVAPEVADNDRGFDEAAMLTAAARMNTTAMDPNFPASLTAAIISNPSYIPGNAAAVTGKGTPPAGLDTTATYAGAVAPTATAGSAWYDGWTAYPQN
jgi:hypothetical protein